MNVEEKMSQLSEKEQLIAKTGAFATMYFWDAWACDYCDEIVETFQKYFELTKDDQNIDKRIIGNASMILGLYRRADNGNEIQAEFKHSSEQMMLFLEGVLEGFDNDCVTEILENNDYIPSDMEQALESMIKYNKI